VGGVTAGVMEGAGALFKGAASEAGDAAEGALSEAEDSAASEAESAGGCALSFVSGTLVATKQGEQAIGTLEVGEQVWAYNSQTRKMELEPIQHLWLTHDTDLVDLTLTTTLKDARGKGTQHSEVLHPNEKHPFLTKEKGFIPVGQLKPGMHVREADGRYGTVVMLVVVPGAMWTYNLTVAQDHTSTVGVGQWIVHNVGGGCGVSSGE
ncbi:MAG TPA: polymorphic toxin-type HINT domain-containing protein, partial [Ktedonobacteraceae bacterium]|nr:polymorphic toxin-type HINT domain-containing protein [Ktedonobacteraceae bacterium]